MDDQTREQLLEAIRRLIAGDYADAAEMERLMDFVEKSVPDPDFYEYMLHDYEEGTTPAEVLERALAYKLIGLPDQSA